AAEMLFFVQEEGSRIVPRGMHLEPEDFERLDALFVGNKLLIFQNSQEVLETIAAPGGGRQIEMLARPQSAPLVDIRDFRHNVGPVSSANSSNERRSALSRNSLNAARCCSIRSDSCESKAASKASSNSLRNCRLISGNS